MSPFTEALQAVFFSPHSIFFPPFLAAGILITILWLKIAHRMSTRQALTSLFDPSAWGRRQAAVDFFFSVLVLAGLSKLIFPMEDFIFDRVSRLENLFGLPEHRILTFKLHPIAEAGLVTVIAMLAYDFASYGMHRLMHKLPLLWRVHAFHHSANQLTFLTTYRQHPLEPILLSVARTSATASSLVAFHYFFPSGSQVITVIGLGAGFFIYMFTVNLHHSPIPVHYPKLLRKILISPHVHHLHHSSDAKHAGKNYGVIFSIWDRWLKTYYDEDVRLNQLRFATQNPMR